MDTWQTILLTLGGNTAIVAILVFLGTKFVEKVFERDSKRFEIELQHKYEIAIERVKNELETRASDHQIRFSKLHERRAETIVEIYGQVNNLAVAAADFLNKYDGSDQVKRRERLDHLWDVGREFRESYSKSRIYFRESTCVLLDKYYETLSNATRNLALNQQHPEIFDDKYETVEEWSKAIHALYNQAPRIKGALEEDFRGMLGVEDTLPAGNVSHTSKPTVTN